jgi:very-short-patch-repair endonuclease
MGASTVQSRHKAAWELAAAQHGVVSRGQLGEHGFSAKAIDHRIGAGRLHPVHRGVYAVGRPELTQHGRWLAAVLACGPGAALSHASAAALWGVRTTGSREIHVSVPAPGRAVHDGIRVHRRTGLTQEETTRRERIPVTAIATTLVDLATQVTRKQLEAAVNEGDKLDLIDPDRLRNELETMQGRRGVARLRSLLDRTTFTLTDSELERRFLPIARRAGLPSPLTQARVNGFRVDFHWPDLNLVVETDGLRYHRTPSQQARDRIRDQRHTAAGMTVLRFTHAQVVHEPRQVQATLAAVVRNTAARGSL